MALTPSCGYPYFNPNHCYGWSNSLIADNNELIRVTWTAVKNPFVTSLLTEMFWGYLKKKRHSFSFWFTSIIFLNTNWKTSNTGVLLRKEHFDVVRGSFKKYVDFCYNFFSRRHITLGFGTHIWTTNSVDLQKNFSNLTRYFRK